jgi:SnoaL-like domain
MNRSPATFGSCQRRKSFQSPLGWQIGHWRSRDRVFDHRGGRRGLRLDPDIIGDAEPTAARSAADLSAPRGMCRRTAIRSAVTICDGTKRKQFLIPGIRLRQCVGGVGGHYRPSPWEPRNGIGIIPGAGRRKGFDVMDTQELAKAFTDMCAKGELEAAGKKFWSDDIVSREPMTGDMAELKGRKAVEGKTQWWNANHEVHDLKVEGPYVHGDQFVVRFKLDVTPKGQKRIHLDEVGLYTVRNGRIVEESFFMGGR